MKLNDRRFGAQLHEDEQLPVNLGAQMPAEIEISLPKTFETEAIGVDYVLIEMATDAAGFDARGTKQKRECDLEFPAGLPTGNQAEAFNNHFEFPNSNADRRSSPAMPVDGAT